MVQAEDGHQQQEKKSSEPWPAKDVEPLTNVRMGELPLPSSSSSNVRWLVEQLLTTNSRGLLRRRLPGSAIHQSPIRGALFQWPETIVAVKDRMGATFSQPIPNIGDVGYVAFVICRRNRFLLLHCPPNVIEMVHHTIR